MQPGEAWVLDEAAAKESTAYMQGKGYYLDWALSTMYARE